MLTLIEIFSIIIIHWIADFIMQSDYDAKNKSKFFHALFSHTITYSSCWFVIILLFGYINKTQTTEWYVLNTLFFVGITFVCHTITDYFTSRLNSKLWAKGDVHNFFVSVGFDQVLHYVQLFLTYQLLK